MILKVVKYVVYLGVDIRLCFRLFRIHPIFIIDGWVRTINITGGEKGRRYLG